MIHLQTTSSFINGEVNLPLSKSIGNRLLIMSYLASELEAFSSIPQVDDSLLLHRLLLDLKSGESDFYVDNAGTVMRFLTALLATIPKQFSIGGNIRMNQRPIKPLVDSLLQLGCKIEYQNKHGFPPLIIQGGELESLEPLKVESEVSSQFLSALLMIAPVVAGGLTIAKPQVVVSQPYIEMTLSLMRKSGITVIESEDFWRVEQGEYLVSNVLNEPDWSSSAFFYSLAALSQSAEIFFPGLQLQSLQGDSAVADFYETLGIKTFTSEQGVTIRRIQSPQHNVTADFSNHPDLALPFIAATAGLGCIGRFTGLQTLKHKESDRMLALSVELAKLDMDLRQVDDSEWVLLNSCRINPAKSFKSDIVFQTYGDHRIAMSLAPLVLKTKSLFVENENVVTKSFPDFWNQIGQFLLLD
ncbi:MAG: 3-phosphoshikimate 1-carboxyvinyltransferase [Bacteroidales bacterium]|nr:3-phosphoshikimate 1-carboxyvinyltransferase [Bacteroidales bacterium]